MKCHNERARGDFPFSHSEPFALSQYVFFLLSSSSFILWVCFLPLCWPHQELKPFVCFFTTFAPQIHFWHVKTRHSLCWYLIWSAVTKWLTKSSYWEWNSRHKCKVHEFLKIFDFWWQFSVKRIYEFLKINLQSSWCLAHQHGFVSAWVETKSLLTS